jgi:hypothetical protein
VLQEAHDFLRPQCNRFSHAIAICDSDGCGKEKKLPRERIEGLIEQNLQSNGWDNRAMAIVIKPELEAWVWVDWHALAEQAGWPGGEASLRDWLLGQGLIKQHQLKPSDPKESLDACSSKRRKVGLLLYSQRWAARPISRPVKTPLSKS